jgi:hypothetical protein
MWKIITGIAAVGILIGVVTVGAGADDKEPSQSGIERAVGVLDQTPTEADTLPAVATSEVESLAPDGTDVANTIKARITDEGSFYLTPTPEGACVSMVSDGGATVRCLPTADIANPTGKRSQSMTFTGCEAPTPESAPECEGAIIYGVAPNGVQEVALDVPNGPVANVTNNVYVLTVHEDQAMASVEYR